MWIKLADKRPAENGEYLCFCKCAGNPYMCVMRYTAQGTRIDLAMTPYRLNEDIWVVVHGDTKHMNKYITHWTTLPDAPGNAQQPLQADSLGARRLTRDQDGARREKMTEESKEDFEQFYQERFSRRIFSGTEFKKIASDIWESAQEVALAKDRATI